MKFSVVQSFPVVRCNVPIPVDMRTAGKQAWRVVGPDGVELETQCEDCERDADGKVRIVEVIALNPKKLVGTFTVLSGVSVFTHRLQPAPFAAQWAAQGPSFMLDGTRIDCAFDLHATKDGPVCQTRSFHGRHLRGWITVYHVLDIVDFVVDFNQGEVGSPHLAFYALDLLGAAGFVSTLPEPGVTAVGDAIELVRTRSDLLLHVLPQRTGRPFRLVLHDGTQQALAQQYADGQGWGCAIEEWKLTGAFQPQGLPLPDLTVKLAEAKSILAGKWNELKAALANGTSTGIGTNPGHPYPAQGSLTDWMHPGGQQYGGATSGSERYQWGLEGVLTCATGDYHGIRALLARATLYAQRMPSLILETDGKPALLERFLHPINGTPTDGWRMSSANTQFDHGGGQVLDKPFGYSDALTRAPLPANVAPEWSEQAKYDELDFQHRDRWAQLLVSLAYLTNDPWAIWRLRCDAETWRMSMFSGKRLVGEFNTVAANPEHGTEFGRAHGECFSMACAAYALSGDEWRARYKPTLIQASEVYLRAQMANGLFRSVVATSKDASVFPGCWDPTFDNGPGKPKGKALHSVTKVSEECQGANFLQCYWGSVETDMFAKVRIQEALVRWATAVQNFLQSKFPAWCATAPPSKIATPYVGVSPLIDASKDYEETGAPIGYAQFAIASTGTPDLSALLTAYVQKPGDPLVALLARPLTKSPGVDDWSPLAAALQAQP